MDEKIYLETEDGEVIEMFAIESTRLNGTDYLLAALSDEDDAECVILRDVSKPEEPDALYEPVEDERELDALFTVFEELLEDVSIER